MASTSTFVPSEMPERRRRVPIVGPFILIGLGILFLGQNIGLWDTVIWSTVWRFWPLLLVAAGLEILLNRSSWAPVLGLIVVLALIGAFVTLTTGIAGLSLNTLNGDGRIEMASGHRSTSHVSYDLENLREAGVQINNGAGEVYVTALPFESSQLIEADMTHSNGRSLTRQIANNGGFAKVSLSATDKFDRGANIDLRNDWNIQLSPKVPVSLDVKSGPGELNMDLRDLNVKKLQITMGASAAKITLPQSAEQTEVSVNAGAADVQVTVPEGVAARIRVHGITGTMVDEGRFPRSGEYYQSPNYDTAANRAVIDVEAGLASVTIR